jgi:hypothetical protein
MECEVGTPLIVLRPSGVLIDHNSQLFQSQDIFPDGAKLPSATLVLGRVKYVHVRNAVLRSNGLSADPAKLRPISRISGMTYARLGEGFDLKRPEWSDVKQILDAQRSSLE